MTATTRRDPGTVSRVTTRRKRQPVTVTRVDPATLPQRKASTAMPDHVREAWAREGVPGPAARTLHRAGVAPHEFGDWTGAGHGAAEIGLDEYGRVAELAAAGVTPTDLSDYPPMWDTALMTLVRHGITADTAHTWGHALGWCCGRPSPASPYVQVDFAALAGWLKYADSPARVVDLYRHEVTRVHNVSEFLVLRAPGRLHDLAVEQDMTPRRLWRTWVEAASGHVQVAHAVCAGGGDLGDVAAWLATGETPKRIALLARAGASPQVMYDPQTRTLTDEDLEVWAALNSVG